MSDDINTQLAVLSIQMRTILEELSEAKERRREQYKANEVVNQSLTDINHRLRIVEASVAETAPTLKEFVQFKHNVIGAGKLGNVLWVVGGVLVGGVAATRSFFLQFLGITPQ